jgi:hypothetical protein
LGSNISNDPRHRRGFFILSAGLAPLHDHAFDKLALRAFVGAQGGIEDGIAAVRASSLLPRFGFDSDRCAKAVEALKLYRSDYDERHSVLRPRPVHDWTSNCADALRYLAVIGELIGDGVARVKNSTDHSICR